MGGFLNQLTQPLGFRLFSGGPYADRGFGDQLQNNAQQYMQQLAPLIQQISQMAGVTNPLTGQGGQFTNDPYGLSALDQAGLNKQSSIDTQAYDQIMQRVKANLTARGMGDSSTMQAAQAYLGQQLQGQIGSERIQAGQNAYQNRQNAMQQIAQLLGQGFGAKQQATGTQLQNATSMNQQAMSQLGSLLALGMYAGGVGPFGAAAAKPGGDTPNINSATNYGASPGGQGWNPSWGPGSDWGGGVFNTMQPINWGSIYRG